LLFIKLLSFPPISGSKNPDDVVPVRETDGQNTVTDASDTIVTGLIGTVLLIGQDYALRVGKGVLVCDKRHTMLLPIQPVFG
jgi:hypothetical protein